jgi:hypothetical protein
MMLGGAFNDAPPEDIVAALSCLIAEEDDKSAGHIQVYKQRDMMKQVCMCTYVCARMCACICAYMCACVRVCLRVCVFRKDMIKQVVHVYMVCKADCV